MSSEIQPIKEEKKTRSFKVRMDGEVRNSVFKGESPYQAANKALSEILRSTIKNGGNVDGEIAFTLIESTKGSNKKEHEYTGYRVKLENPVSYTVSGGQTITKEYKNVLRKVKKLVGGKSKVENN
jgi:hypothetical protein